MVPQAGHTALLVQTSAHVPLASRVLPAGQAHVPLEQLPLQHGVPPAVQVPPFGMHIGVVVDVEVVLVVVEVVLAVQAGAQPTNPGLPATQTSSFVRHCSQLASSRIGQRPEQPIQIVVVPSAAKTQLQLAGQGGSHISGSGAHTPPIRSCTHTSLQHSSLAVQGASTGRHIGVVVEVVLVDVEVVGVSVVVVVGVGVVVCVWQVPLTQTRLSQHWSVLVQCLPSRLHPGGSPAASRMPSDASVPPTRAAPINLRALPRVRLPSASPLASSSKKLSSLAIGRASSQNGGTPQPRRVTPRS